jgi:anti-sigma regulatory factor (Ser/Thr protein kinase)
VDTQEPKVTSTLILVATPNAASLARALVRLVLAQWGLRDVVDDAQLVASELATNAVQATAEEERGLYVNGIQPPPLIRVQVTLFEDFMAIGVWDRSLRVPKAASASAIDEHGRGLVIVENLSARWGWDTVHPYSGHKGKVVWAELTLPHAPVEPAGLPSRMPSRVAVETHGFTDEKVLERVRDGIRRL